MTLITANTGTGNWGTDTDWTPNQVPTIGDEVVIPDLALMIATGSEMVVPDTLLIENGGELQVNDTANIGTSTVVTVESGGVLSFTGGAGDFSYSSNNGKIFVEAGGVCAFSNGAGTASDSYNQGAIFNAGTLTFITGGMGAGGNFGLVIVQDGGVVESTTAANAGIMVVEDGGSAEFESDSDNVMSGTLVVESGAEVLFDGSENRGTIFVEPNATVTFNNSSDNWGLILQYSGSTSDWASSNNLFMSFICDGATDNTGGTPPLDIPERVRSASHADPTNVRAGEFYAGAYWEGACAVPAATDVRSGTAVDAGVGTCAVPAAGNVRHGTAVDATTGTCRVPAAADVQSGVLVDATSGTLALPSEAQVAEGVGFGADGTEFTGSLEVESAAPVRHIRFRR